jgi:hypothetical protein
MRKLLVLLFALGFAGVLYADGPFTGTWKLNVAKSKFASGRPAPKEETVTVTENTKTRDVTVNGIDMSGKSSTTHFTYPIRGGPVTFLDGGPTDGSTQSVRRVGAKTFRETTTKDGKKVESESITVSPDGNTMRIAAEGTPPDGKPFSSVTVFDKQ